MPRHHQVYRSPTLAPLVWNGGGPHLSGHYCNIELISSKKNMSQNDKDLISIPLYTSHRPGFLARQGPILLANAIKLQIGFNIETKGSQYSRWPKS